MIRYYWIRLKMKYHYYVTKDMSKYDVLWEKKSKVKYYSNRKKGTKGLYQLTIVHIAVALHSVVIKEDFYGI